MLKIGVQSAGWYKHEDALASFAYIQSCGFDAVDFNIDHYLNTGKLDKEGITETFFDQSTEDILAFFKPLKEASEKTGVEIAQMHAPFPCAFDDNEEVNAYIRMALEKCFAVCTYVGCPAIVVHPVGGAVREEEYQKNLALYRPLIPIIQKYPGVKICLENIFTSRATRKTEGRFSNPDDACRMIDQLNAEAGSDFFGFCLDVGHAALTGKNIRDFIRTLGHRLTVLHIHDNNALDDLHMIPYSYLANGSAHVCDWQGFVDGLREIGYTGALAFETFRIFSAYPAPVHTEALRLIAAIGSYWKTQIETPAE